MQKPAESELLGLAIGKELCGKERVTELLCHESEVLVARA